MADLFCSLPELWCVEFLFAPDLSDEAAVDFAFLAGFGSGFVAAAVACIKLEDLAACVCGIS